MNYEPWDIVKSPTREWVINYFKGIYPPENHETIVFIVDKHLECGGYFGSYRLFYCFVEEGIKKKIDNQIKPKPKFRFWQPFRNKKLETN